jgi:hypothetical protein
MQHAVWKKQDVFTGDKGKWKHDKRIKFVLVRILDICYNKRWRVKMRTKGF